MTFSLLSPVDFTPVRWEFRFREAALETPAMRGWLNAYEREIIADMERQRLARGVFDAREVDMGASPADNAADALRDASHGQYLCETCWDAMTDLVVDAHRSGTGLAMARCEVCQAEGQ